MTYIVGFGQPGMNAILADTRVSWSMPDGTVEGRDGDVKIGLLFRGCIYGALGSEAGGRQFLKAFKESIHGQADTIAGFWNRFERFSGEYPYREDQHFQLLLSQRGTGMPRFAFLDSRLGLDQAVVPHDHYLLAFGSGREVLNETLQGVYAPRLQTLQRELLRSMQPPERVTLLSPYFLCLWLCEQSLTFEASLLNSHGVGGVFHFASQGPSFEAPQQPAVYVFSQADRSSRSIRAWLYRIAAVQGGLYVESHAPADTPETAGRVKKLVSFDTAARYDAASYTEDQLRAMVDQELGSLPFYFFCGFGFTDPTDRRSVGFIASSRGQRGDVFDESGKIVPAFAAQIVRNFDDCQPRQLL
jgi:hypothetical protein